MNTQAIKTKLIAALGTKATAHIQALRFVYLLKTDKTPDPEVQFINSFLRKRDTAIDIGANGANWTYYLHQCIGEEGMVFAFEADPYYALATELTIKLLRLKGVHFFSFGLSNRNEQVPLRIADSTGQRYSGLGHVDKDADTNDDNVVMVQLRTLDSMVQEYPRLLQTKLIKCDVEGYELFVFQGTDQILTTSRPFVILEVGSYDKHGYTARDVYDFFVDRQYSCFAMVETRTLSATDAMMNHDEAISVNRVLIPKEKLALLQERCSDWRFGGGC